MVADIAGIEGQLIAVFGSLAMRRLLCDFRVFDDFEVIADFADDADGFGRNGLFHYLRGVR